MNELIFRLANEAQQSNPKGLRVGEVRRDGEKLKVL